MPLYLYRCSQGHESELSRPVERANDDVHCPECGQPARRLHRLGGIAFRGPGFHNTDYQVGANRD